tara:strand:+ start:4298 stop:7009 length:2712 start_codon:yes stop_codon:yes gene_type:complete
MSEDDEHYVVKRDGNREKVSFDKILNRIKKLGQPKQLNVNYTGLVMKIIDQIYNNIETEKIDEVMAQQCASMCSVHYDYYNLASYLVISNHEKKTTKTLLEYISLIYQQPNQNYISDNFYKLISSHHEEYEAIIDTSRNYYIDYFGFKTLERAYLMKHKGKIIETIQYMWMRVAIQIHGNNMEKVKETYDCLSNKDFIHATPTLFNSGTKRPQLSSCFLLGMEDDSIKGIFNTLSDCASISKWAGGIGLHIHNIRSEGTKISGTNGLSNGLVPMLRVYNNTARYCDQGGGKRKGSFAMYLETWHADIESFLELKKNHGDEESRARDLFYALWICDYFMECVEKNGDWYLMSPDECPGLHDTYGEEFKQLYIQYVKENKYLKSLKARDMWFKILDSQMETGTPYMLYKDACNEKSNQKNIGTIKSSNLCSEIVEYSDDKESAVCNLASISLPACVKYDENNNAYFCYDKLEDITKILTNNLNIIIDCNFYPTDKTMRSNLRHRPIGIGVQGLADVFAKMKISFDSEDAEILNKNIFETIYYGSMVQSNNISISRRTCMNSIQTEFINEMFKQNNSNIKCIMKELFENDFYKEDFKYNLCETKEINEMINDCYHKMKPSFEELFGTKFKNVFKEYIQQQYQNYGNIVENYHEIPEHFKNLIRDGCIVGSYSTFENSPLSQGKFQFDLWNIPQTSRHDWDTLRENIINFGVRNSLCVALMPTASTSQILGNNECFEPFTSNIYMRRTLAGEFMLANKYLIQTLSENNLWNSKIKNDIIREKGSIQNIDAIPEKIKSIFKIVWEIDPKVLINMARDRGAYVCQSQSMNLWIDDPNYKNLTKTHFYAWKQGLKTGIYYLRRKAKHQAQQFTVEPIKQPDNPEKNINSFGSSGNLEQVNEDEGCLMCSG